MDAIRKQELIKQYGRHEGDTGSPEVQDSLYRAGFIRSIILKKLKLKNRKTWREVIKWLMY